MPARWCFYWYSYFLNVSWEVACRVCLFVSPQIGEGKRHFQEVQMVWTEEVVEDGSVHQPDQEWRPAAK
jgi:hypothetical protein